MPIFGGPFAADDTDSVSGVDKYTSQLKHLLPPGRLLDLSPGSVISRFLGGLAVELARVEARAADLVLETDPRSAVETLPEWERMLGLPDARVPVIPTGTAERQRAVTQKFANRGGQNDAFFAKLCADCGYTVGGVGLHAGNGLHRVDDRIGARVYGSAWAYSMTIVLTNVADDAIPQADFERVVRHATQSHVVVVFEYP